MKKYRRKFIELSKYAPTNVVDSRVKLKNIVMGVSNLVVNECR